jgi:hypothetical protein
MAFAKGLCQKRNKFLSGLVEAFLKEFTILKNPRFLSPESTVVHQNLFFSYLRDK